MAGGKSKGGLAVSEQIKLDALIEQGKMTSRSIEMLTGEIREVIKIITKGFAQQSSSPGIINVGPGGGNSNGTRQVSNNWALLLAVAGIIFGLLTPMYNQVESLSKQNAAMQLAMTVDNERERMDGAAIAQLTTSIGQIETQFDFIRELISINAKAESVAIGKLQLWAENHDLRVRGLNSAQWERIRFLELQTYGKAMPIIGGLGAGSEEQR